MERAEMLGRKFFEIGKRVSAEMNGTNIRDKWEDAPESDRAMISRVVEEFADEIKPQEHTVRVSIDSFHHAEVKFHDALLAKAPETFTESRLTATFHEAMNQRAGYQASMNKDLLSRIIAGGLRAARQDHPGMTDADLTASISKRIAGTLWGTFREYHPRQYTPESINASLEAERDTAIKKGELLAGLYGTALIAIADFGTFVDASEKVMSDKYEACLYCARHNTVGHAEGCALLKAKKLVMDQKARLDAAVDTEKLMAKEAR